MRAVCWDATEIAPHDSWQEATEVFARLFDGVLRAFFGEMITFKKQFFAKVALLNAAGNQFQW